MGDDAKQEIISRLIDSVPTLLIVLGVVVNILGLAGGVTYHQWLPINETAWRIGTVVVGMALLALGFFQSRKDFTVPQARKYGINIQHPAEGERVGVVDVKGTIKKALPDGYALKILRIYPGTDNFIPVGEARVDIEKGIWKAENCDIGGVPGDRRSIGAYLIGPGGAILLDYFVKASRVHNKLRDEVGKKGEFLPLLEKRTPDMVECDRISVWRG
jgi:hypothetical protein